MSPDPEARARQLANLKPGFVRADAALKHGARSEAIVLADSSMYVAELQRTYPGESEVWVRLQARRMAKIARLSAYLEGRPSEVLNQRHGKLNPAMAEEERLTQALLADLGRADQRRAAAGANGVGGLERLRRQGAAITGGRDGG